MGLQTKILVVEDSAAIVERLVESIKEIAGAELVGTVDNEADAVDLACRSAADLIVLDLHLRQGTGFGVMRALAHASVKPRIIVFTSFDLPEYKNAALSLGARHFLGKVRDVGQLAQTLKDLCRESQAGSS